jgi:hypothetical protein
LSAIQILDKLQDLEMVPMDRLVKELASFTPIDTSLGFKDWPNWVYALLGLSIALLIGIIIFAYRYYKKRWSGKFWQRKPIRGEDHFPLVTVNTSGDENAGRNSKPSAPKLPAIYSNEKDAVDTLKQLYPAIRVEANGERIVT